MSVSGMLTDLYCAFSVSWCAAVAFTSYRHSSNLQLHEGFQLGRFKVTVARLFALRHQRNEHVPSAQPRRDPGAFQVQSSTSLAHSADVSSAARPYRRSSGFKRLYHLPRGRAISRSTNREWLKTLGPASRSCLDDIESSEKPSLRANEQNESRSQAPTSNGRDWNVASMSLIFEPCFAKL